MAEPPQQPKKRTGLRRPIYGLIPTVQTSSGAPVATSRKRTVVDIDLADALQRTHLDQWSSRSSLLYSENPSEPLSLGLVGNNNNSSTNNVYRDISLATLQQTFTTTPTSMYGTTLTEIANQNNSDNNQLNRQSIFGNARQSNDLGMMPTSNSAFVSDNIPQTPKKSRRLTGPGAGATAGAPGTPSGLTTPRRRSKNAQPVLHTTPLKAMGEAAAARKYRLQDAAKRVDLARERLSPMVLLRMLSRAPGFVPPQVAHDPTPIPGSENWKKLTPKSPGGSRRASRHDTDVQLAKASFEMNEGQVFDDDEEDDEEEGLNDTFQAQLHPGQRSIERQRNIQRLSSRTRPSMGNHTFDLTGFWNEDPRRAGTEFNVIPRLLTHQQDAELLSDDLWEDVEDENLFQVVAEERRSHRSFEVSIAGLVDELELKASRVESDAEREERKEGAEDLAAGVLTRKYTATNIEPMSDIMVQHQEFEAPEGFEVMDSLSSLPSFSGVVVQHRASHRAVEETQTAIEEDPDRMNPEALFGRAEDNRQQQGQTRSPEKKQDDGEFPDSGEQQALGAVADKNTATDEGAHVELHLSVGDSAGLTTDEQNDESLLPRVLTDETTATEDEVLGTFTAVDEQAVSEMTVADVNTGDGAEANNGAVAIVQQPIEEGMDMDLDAEEDPRSDMGDLAEMEVRQPLSVFNDQIPSSPMKTAEQIQQEQEEEQQRLYDEEIEALFVDDELDQVAQLEIDDREQDQQDFEGLKRMGELELDDSRPDDPQVDELEHDELGQNEPRDDFEEYGQQERQQLQHVDDEVHEQLDQQFPDDEPLHLDYAEQDRRDQAEAEASEIAAAEREEEERERLLRRRQDALEQATAAARRVSTARYMKELPAETTLLQNSKATAVSMTGMRYGQGRKRVRKSRTGEIVPSLPASLVKQLVQTFSKTKISKEAMEAITEASHEFFEQASGDLAAYARHAGRKTFDDSDVECLLRRLRVTNSKVSLESLLQRYLPRELRDLVLFPDEIHSQSL